MKPRPRRRPPARLVLGPILHARGPQGDRWRVSACVLMGGEEEPPDLKVSGINLPVPPRFLHDWGHVDRSTGPLSLWRYDFAVPRGLLDGRASYGFLHQDEQWHFAVPGTASPLRLGHVSGMAPDEDEVVPALNQPRNARWSHLLGSHRASPLHMLLMGGPQVQAGGLWRHVPALRDIGALPSAQRAAAPLPDDVALQLDVWFLASYRYAWGQAEPAALLSSAPILANWGEADLFPGWGSLPSDVRGSPLHRTIFASASRAARLFQLGMAEDDPPENVWGALTSGPHDHSQGIVLNGTGIIAIDLWSGRGKDRLLSPTTRIALPEWLERVQGCRQLLVMVGDPPGFPAPGLLDRMIGAIPGRGRSDGSPELIWHDPAALADREWLIRHLMDFARSSRCRVVLLSGGLGTAGFGAIRGLGAEIVQLLAPRLVQPGPVQQELRILERVASRVEGLQGGMAAEIGSWAESGRRLLASRGWIALFLDTDGGMTVEWQLEGEGQIQQRI